MTFPLRCGRLDRHPAHDWTRPGTLRTWHCNGYVVTEGASRAQDEADDAAEERAIRDRREEAAS